MVPQMPFAKQSRRVSGGFGELGKRRFTQIQSGMAMTLCRDDPCDTGALRVSPCQEGSPRGTAHRAVGMKIGKADTLRGKSVDVWCFESLASETPQVSISQIIGKDNDDIGLWVPASAPNGGRPQRGERDRAKGF